MTFETPIGVSPGVLTQSAVCARPTRAVLQPVRRLSGSLQKRRREPRTHHARRHRGGHAANEALDTAQGRGLDLPGQVRRNLREHGHRHELLARHACPHAQADRVRMRRQVHGRDSQRLVPAGRGGGVSTHDRVRGRVLGRLRGRVWDSVWYRVRGLVWNRVRRRVGDPVREAAR